MEETQRGVDFPAFLPEELTMLIFELLDVKTLGIVAKVSKTWRRLGNDPLLWWHKLSEADVPGGTMMSLVSRFTGNCKLAYKAALFGGTLIVFGDRHGVMRPYRRVAEKPLFTGVFCGRSAAFLINGGGEVYSFGGASFGTQGELRGTLMLPVKCQTLAWQREMITQIAVGDEHAVFLSHSRKVFSSGNNRDGRLGHGDTLRQTNPVEIRALMNRDICYVAAGSNFSLAISRTSKLYSWGGNAYGQLGVGTRMSSLIPKVVSFPNGERVKQVHCHEFSVVALASSGRVFCWGKNDANLLCVSEKPIVTTPLLVECLANEEIVSIGGGLHHSLALSTDGRLFAFGQNDHAQLGTGTDEPMDGVIQVPLKVRVSQIYSGSSDNSFVSGSDGEVYAWGYNRAMNLGVRESSTQKSPVVVEFFRGRKIYAMDCTLFKTIVVAWEEPPQGFKRALSTTPAPMPRALYPQ